MRRRAVLAGLLASVSAQAETQGQIGFDGLYKNFGVRGLVFSDSVATPIRKAKHGDSSGVRGAAFLWKE